MIFPLCKRQIRFFLLSQGEKVVKIWSIPLFHLCTCRRSQRLTCALSIHKNIKHKTLTNSICRTIHHCICNLLIEKLKMKTTVKNTNKQKHRDIASIQDLIRKMYYIRCNTCIFIMNQIFYIKWWKRRRKEKTNAMPFHLWKCFGLRVVLRAKTKSKNRKK